MYTWEQRMKQSFVQERNQGSEFDRRQTHLVWGIDYVVTVKIPQIIDNHNHWMLDVDLVDRLIAYYRPTICCQRTWMPLFLHCADIIKINS